MEKKNKDYEKELKDAVSAFSTLVNKVGFWYAYNMFMLDFLKPNKQIIFIDIGEA